MSKAVAASPDARRQLASLPLAVLLLGPDQTIAAVNPAAEQFLGQSARRLTSRSLFDVLDFADERLIARIRESDAPLSARQVDVAVLGQVRRRIDVTFAPVADEPGWQMLTLLDHAADMGDGGASRDDSVLRAPEILAHEIKNPLAGIRGAAQLLARKVGDAEKPLTTLIADEVDRIAKLIDQMQSLSRRTTEPVAPCNLHEAVRHASAIISAAADGGPRIEEEFDPSLPPVLGSANGLVQVLINLLANAREACREVAHPRVIVRTRFASGLQLQSTARGKPVRLPIELRVSDNGPGIDPAMRELVFEPFVTTKKTGQGLGLALVRKLVGDMNGRIAYERDEVGGWTHFRLHLPLAVESARSARSVKAG
ncbi:MAG: PAS domain-containing protein [Sphingomonadales bacterium]|nr:PAS domain-containing protein [Sphingomonadales bacterium]